MTKKRVLIGATATADLDRCIYRAKDAEDYSKQLERAAKDFNEFIRDHRSMDHVYLQVDRQYEDQCSFCGRIWEEPPLCCDKAMEEYEKEHEGAYDSV